MIKKDKLPDCPVEITVALIENKWRLLILRNLFERPYNRFKELKKPLDGISQKILSENLKNMIDNEIIERIEYDEKILHTEYKLTTLEESMRPIIKSLELWGSKYKDNQTRTVISTKTEQSHTV